VAPPAGAECATGDEVAAAVLLEERVMAEVREAVLVADGERGVAVDEAVRAAEDEAVRVAAAEDEGVGAALEEDERVGAAVEEEEGGGSGEATGEGAAAAAAIPAAMILVGAPAPGATPYTMAQFRASPAAMDPKLAPRPMV